MRPSYLSSSTMILVDNHKKLYCTIDPSYVEFRNHHRHRACRIQSASIQLERLTDIMPTYLTRDLKT